MALEPFNLSLAVSKHCAFLAFHTQWNVLALIPAWESTLSLGKPAWFDEPVFNPGITHS